MTFYNTSSSLFPLGEYKITANILLAISLSFLTDKEFNL